MSDRVDRAAQVIGDAIGVAPDIPSGAMYVDATDAARALDEAGMLADHHRLRAFARDCVTHGDMTPAAQRMLGRILEDT